LDAEVAALNARELDAQGLHVDADSPVGNRAFD
jgi:hypothetical protein